ncbi:MAG: hypothetical protein NC251_11855 [Lachnoclostridium sp.]|nr:hypothetical protein [Lachnoclostridium sp.]MCM1535142.1 hypothetical protein [Clostridium sp.]
MKRYDEYKATGIAWIPYIPCGWNMVKINDLFAERKEKVSDRDYPPLSVTKFGVLSQLPTAVKTQDGENRKRVCKGDFVINSRSDRRGSSGISPLDGSVSLINIVLMPRQGTSYYYHYLLRSHTFIEEFYHNGRGIVADLWTTRYSEMRNILVPLPSYEEQCSIVNYLNWQKAIFNSIIPEKAITKGNLIASSKSLLAQEIMLIDEYRTRLFSDVVTGQIDVRDIEIPEYEFVEEDTNGESEENIESAEGEMDEE